MDTDNNAMDNDPDELLSTVVILDSTGKPKYPLPDDEEVVEEVIADGTEYKG